MFQSAKAVRRAGEEKPLHYVGMLERPSWMFARRSGLYVAEGFNRALLLLTSVAYILSTPFDHRPLWSLAVSHNPQANVSTAYLQLSSVNAKEALMPHLMQFVTNAANAGIIHPLVPALAVLDIEPHANFSTELPLQAAPLLEARPVVALLVVAPPVATQGLAQALHCKWKVRGLSGLSAGAIAGIAIGATAVILIIIALGAILMYQRGWHARRKKGERNVAAEKSGNEYQSVAAIRKTWSHNSIHIEVSKCRGAI
jgi:hypothetical protein